MSSAPKASLDTDYDFILSCLKNTKEKPNFEEVARELGLKNKDAAYKRHWSIMKKHGLAGNTGKGRKPATGNTGIGDLTSTPKKRGRKVKKEEIGDEIEDVDELGGGDDDDNEEIKTPSKKQKVEVKVKEEDAVNMEVDEKTA